MWLALHLVSGKAYDASKVLVSSIPWGTIGKPVDFTVDASKAGSSPHIPWNLDLHWIFGEKHFDIKKALDILPLGLFSATFTWVD